MSFFSNTRKIWLTYVVALGLLAAALAWFSFTTIRLDLQVEANRRQIERAEKEAIEQERISYALWRMDWLLTPLVAQEAARNHWMYESLIPTAGNTSWLRPEIERQQRLQRGFANSDLAQQNSPAQTEAQPQQQLPTPDDQSSQTEGVHNEERIPPQVTSPLVMRPTPFVKLHFQIDEANRFSSPQVPQNEAFQLACEMGLINESILADNRARLNEISGEFQFSSLVEACSDKNLPEIMGTGLVWSLGLEARDSNGAAQSQSEELFIDKGGRIDELLHAKAQGLKGHSASKSAPLAKGSKAVDYDSRAATANQAALSQRAMNVSQVPTPESQQVAEGVMRAIWYQNKLLLARRVERENKSYIQGCWLDWDAIKASLLREISDVVPNADLVPRMSELDVESNRALATLPVDLRIIRPNLSNRDSSSAASFSEMSLPIATEDWDLDRAKHENASLSPGVYRSLAIAWGGFLLTAFSTAWLIAGVIQLSERRSAFASAVTHELRTPLTTFRLYSEMLDSGMVTSQEQSQIYTKGLVAEADRLSRLVDNVLQFSRLERKQAHVRKTSMLVRALLDDVLERCRPRVAAAKMDCQVTLAEELEGVFIETSKDTVEQIVFNLIDNACKYAGSGDHSLIRISADIEKRWLVLRIRDFGPGIDRKMIRRLFRPFARSSDETAGTASGVGLGLSLSRQLAKQLHGRLDYVAANPGCLFELRLPLG